jgi:hypothetical protein
MSFMAAQVLWLTGTPAMDRARGVDGIFSPRSGLLVRCSEYWKSTDRCRVAENRADFESPKFPLKSKAQISDGPGGRFFVMRGKRFSCQIDALLSLKIIEWE